MMIDTWLDLNTVNLLGRVDSRIDKEKLVKIVARNYMLGNVKKFRQIHEGFEDYNIRLTTTKGTYLFKLFSQYKSFRHVKDNISGLIHFQKAAVDVPHLVSNRQGKYLFHYEKGDVFALGCVMEYFSAKSFLKLKQEPSTQEIKKIIQNMVKIHTVKFRPLGIYDVWSVVNLSYEFQKKKDFLSKQDKIRVLDAERLFGQVDLRRCTKGVIHGDMQRSNVLRSKKGEIRIIDFSVMEYNALVIDIAIFISLFCINPFIMLAGEIEKQYRFVVREYTKLKKLSGYDLKALPTLVFATYAINNLAASYEKKGKGANNEETQYWVDLGSKGMEKLQPLLTKLQNFK